MVKQLTFEDTNMEHKELKGIVELNHEIAKLKYLAMGIGPGRKDGQELRDKLVKTRQKCWDICRHTRDDLLPAVLRQSSVGPELDDKPLDEGSASLLEEVEVVESVTAVSRVSVMSHPDASLPVINIIVCSLERLIRELARLHSLVTSFPLHSGVRAIEFPEKITPVDTLVRLTSTGCMISPAMAHIAAAEIIRAEGEMEVARIARDRKEVLDIMYSLGYAKWAQIRDKKTDKGVASDSELLISGPSGQGGGGYVGSSSVPVCCMLYCACRKTYI